MAAARWSRRASHDLLSILTWIEANRAPEAAVRLTLEVGEAVRRAAQHPEMYAWVGSLHPSLEHLPRSFRRVLTRNRQHVVYYRHRSDADEIEVMALRGAGQLPPAAEELAP